MTMRMNPDCLGLATAGRPELEHPGSESRGIGLAVRALSALWGRFAAATRPFPRADPAQPSLFLDTEATWWPR
jgi:hypothetical protein